MVTLASSASAQGQFLTNPLPIQNITHLIPIKLTKDNYILWKSLWTPVLESFELDSFVADESAAPTKILTTVNAAGVSVPSINPEYQSWRKKDQQLLIWLNATISESLLSYVIGAPSSYVLWTSLSNMFAAISRSRVLHLKSRL